MAAFLPAFEKMIDNEGGYTLHRVEGDRGGATYAGIARNFHPDWEGWPLLDAGVPDSQLMPHVAAFYQQHFWERIRGDFIDSQRVAETLFDLAVNAGLSAASKLAQEVADVYVDGIIGTKSLKAINNMPPEVFLHGYALKKVARYAEIVNHNPSQAKFLLGWINRTLKGIA